MTLDEIRQAAATCTLCALHKGRENPVFDKGDPNSKLMICGMVPGPDENKIGIPFVGRSGKLLDKILETVELTLDNIYVSNLVKCLLAPGKQLMPIWIASCLSYIISQISIIKPNVIITLGLDASKALLNLDDDVRMRNIRGAVFNYSDEIEIIPTYHPSYILRRGATESKEYQEVVADFFFAKFIIEDKMEK